MPRFIPIQDMTISHELADTDYVPVSDGETSFAVPASKFKAYSTDRAEAAAAAAETAQEAAETAAAHLVIDTSLSVSGAAADAAAVGDILEALRPDNAVSILAFVPRKTQTTSGITYTWQSGTMTLSGTAGSIGAACNILSDIDGSGVDLPDGVAPGDKLYIEATGLVNDAIRLNVTFFDGTTVVGTNYYLSSSSVVTIPSGINKMRVRVYIKGGETVDTTVSIQITTTMTNKELTADATEMAVAVEALKSALNLDNAVNLLNYIKTSGASAGVTYAFENGEMSVSGMASADTICKILVDGAGYGVDLPDGINVGGTLYVKTSGLSDGVRLNVTFFDGTTVVGTDWYISNDTTTAIIVPSTANKIRVRVYVTNGTTIPSGTVLGISITNSKTNKEITEIIEIIDDLGEKTLMQRSNPEAGTDLDTVTDPGWYVLSSNISYIHFPAELGTEGAVLIVFSHNNIPLQVIFGANTGTNKLLYRSGRNGSFVGRNWEFVNPKEPTETFLKATTANPVDYSSRLALLPPNTYVWVDSTAWDDAPSDKSSLMYVVSLSNNTGTMTTQGTQLAVVPTTGHIYTRRISVGEWTDWVDSMGTAKYRTAKKYVAFGDSVIWGSVWWASIEDKDKNPVRAKTEYQVPTRIALATGMVNNYVNEGISGIGYIYPKDGTTLVEYIAGYDLSDAEMVTIHGGGNDKRHSDAPLGTSSATAGDGTICGAIQSIIDDLRARYPKLQIIIMQPMSSGVGPGLSPWTTRLEGGWSMDDFDEQVSALCRRNHVGYVNWSECSYMNSWPEMNIGYAYGSTTPNYTHPLEEFDYCILGDFIAGKVAALFRSLN